MSGDPHGWQILAISVAALLLGPGIHRALRREPVTMAALDNFVLVAVVGLVMIEIVPGALELAGWPALLALALGILGPALAEGPLRLAPRGTHGTALALAIVGMAVHSFTDGLALASAHRLGEGHAIEVAVIAHQLPVAVAVWWLLAPLGLVRASAAMTLLGAATVAGYLLADRSLGALPPAWLGLFHATVGGLLLHVVAHRSHPHEHGHDHHHARPTGRARVAASLGGLAGLGLLALLARDVHSHGHADEGPLGQVLAGLLDLARDSAPALLLAFVLAGLVATFLPAAPVRWLRRGRPLEQAARGVAFGLPLPLCSCGVVPVYRGLLRRGAPAAGAMAFLVATPELGLDAVLLSLPLLGGEMTLARVVGAVVVALVVGWAVGGLADGERPPRELSEGTGPRGPLGARLREGVLEVGLGEMVDATAPWIVFGLLLAAMIQPWLGPELFAAIPAAAQVPLMAVIGVPTYVCASGATPLVAVLLARGLSPGAALAFLLTGPATNATTYGLLRGLHGPRVAAAFTATMIGLAVALGYGLDLVAPRLGASTAAAAHVHAAPGLLSDLALAALGGLFLASFLRQTPQGFVQRLWERDDHDHEPDGCTSCAHDDAREHAREEHAHGHDGHGHAREEHAHGHDGHGHAREEHAHGHDGHGHAHEGHAHGHDGHAHAHEGHAHGHDGHAHAHEGHAHEGHAHGHDGHAHAHEGHAHGHEGHGHAHEGHAHGHEDHEPPHRRGAQTDADRSP
jgi:hypothetical protein